jgi:UDP-N-acetylglucosamine/UDP-N-acetylgalactosamine diphosphorylase
MSIQANLDSALSQGVSRKDALLQLLTAYGQEHLVQFWEQLNTAERDQLSEQIAKIDHGQLARLFRGNVQGPDWAALAARAKAPPAFRLDGKGNRFTVDEARQRGREALASGKIGAVLVAGGQGTRLGFDHPKGMYPIGPVSGSPLFKILFEKILASARRYGVSIPLYLMTSPATHDETVSFLGSQQRFGLPERDVKIFCQGTMPAVDAETGKVLLAARGEVFTSPDGHGGTLAALDKSGALADMRRRGIEQLFYFQVDNPLVEVCDPVFIGYHLLSKSELSTQVVAKQFPAEKVGNVVSIDGKVQIIEYSDLPKEAGERRNADGSLELWAGNIAVHVFDVAFLDRVKGDEQSLPFHLANKAVPFVGADGQLVEPKKPNAIKFERFIFDLLPAAERPIVVEVDGSKVFAPVKNAPGSDRDSPETVKRQMIALHRSWLEQAGARVAETAAVEISPLFALDAEEVTRKVERGREFSEDTYLF